MPKPDFKKCKGMPIIVSCEHGDFGLTYIRHLRTKANKDSWFISVDADVSWQKKPIEIGIIIPYVEEVPAVEISKLCKRMDAYITKRLKQIARAKKRKAKQQAKLNKQKKAVIIKTAMR